MIEAAEKLGAGFDQQRVDLYVVGDDIYFGEFAIYEESGLSVPLPDDEKFGDFPSHALDKAFGDKWGNTESYPVDAKLRRALFG